MAALPYMPFFVGDYLGDTAHLTRSEHGAYLLLIMAYWQRGEPLPADDRKLARLSRSTPEEWIEVKEVLTDFFVEKDGLWTHKRIDEELALARAKVEKASLAGKKSAYSRARSASVQPESNTRSTDVQPPFNECSTPVDAELNYPEPEPDKELGNNTREGVSSEPPTPVHKRFQKPSREEIQAYCQERKNRVNPDAFIAFYDSNGWKVGKNPMKDWRGCVRTWELRDQNIRNNQPLKVSQRTTQLDMAEV